MQTFDSARLETSLILMQPETLKSGCNKQAIADLDQAIASCSTFADATEKLLLNGQIPAARRTFSEAEQAFEVVQQRISGPAEAQFETDANERVNRLGTQLDALWVRLICRFA